MVPSRPSTAIGRRRCSPTSVSPAIVNAKGAVFFDLPAAARARRAARGGVRRRQEGAQPRLPEAAHAAVVGCLVHGRRLASRIAPRVCRARTADGSGRSEICVEAMSADTRVRLRDYLADTWGIKATLTRRGAVQKAVLVFAKDETAKLHALIAPFVHPSMEYKLLERFQGRFAVEPVFAPVRHDAGAHADPQHHREAADAAACTASISKSMARTTTSSMA